MIVNIGLVIVIFLLANIFGYPVCLLVLNRRVFSYFRGMLHLGEKVEYSWKEAAPTFWQALVLTLAWTFFGLLLGLSAATPGWWKVSFAGLAFLLFLWQIRPFLNQLASKDKKAVARRKKTKTVTFFVVATVAFLILLGLRFPDVSLSPGNFFNAEWLKFNLVSTLMWYAIMVVGLSALVHRRIFWRMTGLSIVLIAFLLVLGLRPGFMLEGTSHSIPFFMEIPGDSQLSSLMTNTEPTCIIHPFNPEHKNDWRELFPVKKGDVIAVNWEGYFRFGWGDLTGKSIDEGTVYYDEYAKLLRDPNAHGRSPVIGAKDGILKRVSSFKGPNSRELKRTFFLAVMRESGEAVIFPTNAPKSNGSYGNRDEGYASFQTIRVWHFPAEVFK